MVTKNLNGKNLPVLIKYDFATNKLVITDYAKKYFGKRRCELKFQPQGNETTAGLEIDSDEQTFKLKLVPTTTNFQIKIDYNTDFSNQNLFFRIVDG